jgi:hypothetical protein
VQSYYTASKCNVKNSSFSPLSRNVFVDVAAGADNYLSHREDGSSDVSRYERGLEVSISLPSYDVDMPPPPYASPKPSFLLPSYDDVPPPYEDFIAASNALDINANNDEFEARCGI